MECEGGVTHSHQNLRHIGEEKQENGWHYIVAQVGIKAHFEVTRHFGTAVFANATFNCLFSCLGLFLNLQAAECKCNSLGCSHTRVTHVELYTILPNEPSNSSNPTYVVAILILLRYLGQTSTLSRWI